MPFHADRIDVAGNISKRFSASGFGSRASPACARAGTSSRRSSRRA
ncbi:MAG: short-chain fatty acyl-CoA regulator family protein [Polyangiaceae bacterium]